MNGDTTNASGGAYAYDLPLELIAQSPAPRRSASRLLLVERGGERVQEGVFADLPGLLRSGDLLVVNDSRVIPARLRLRRLPGGGRMELLLVQPTADGGWLAMGRPARRLRPGDELAFAADPGSAPAVRVVGRGEDGLVAVTAVAGDLAALAERHGETPLPPYIRRAGAGADAPELTAQDRDRYQTVYARENGSVAAPTAGLHFEDGLLDELASGGVDLARVTLHVGPGTFRPPTDDEIRRRRLHAEAFTLPAATWRALREARARGGRVVAVGTTTLRVLETVRRLGLDADGPDRRRWPITDEADPVFSGEAAREGGDWRVAGVTRLFLRPPDVIDSVDGLVTNFHLPQSSLLMLVAAFAGERTWRAAYAHAVRERYRFYSYGDAMVIRPRGDRGGER